MDFLERAFTGKQMTFFQDKLPVFADWSESAVLEVWRDKDGFMSLACSERFCQAWLRKDSGSTLVLHGSPFTGSQKRNSATVGGAAQKDLGGIALSRADGRPQRLQGTWEAGEED